jgi:DNA-binding NtrC family response regulator
MSKMSNEKPSTVLKERPVIFIVDDEKNTREGLKKALESAGYRILLAADGEETLRIMKSERVDLLLTDLRMPGMDGLELLRKVIGIQPGVITILLTAYGTVETAVQAMKEGAYDYITKPINIDRLEIIVQRALSTRVLEMENIELRKKLDERYRIENILGRSKAIEEIRKTVKQVAPTKATVLIEGESGTGKELIALAIHGLSDRKDHPFVAVHCAALAEGLLESELFGHEKGAFTGAVKKRIGRFEMADTGTLFLDEISEMGAETQVKLLRVLQEQEFERVGGSETINIDVRLVAATNTELEALIGEGKFREDLYYRLNVVRLHVPPLRERSEDIPLLVKAFIAEFNVANKKSVEGLTAEAMDILLSYSWPGNVRELRNCIEGVVVLSRRRMIHPEDLPIKIRQGDKKTYSEKEDDATLKGLERKTIEAALLKAGGNKTEAAKILGISRRTLHRKIKNYNLK